MYKIPINSNELKESRLVNLYLYCQYDFSNISLQLHCIFLLRLRIWKEAIKKRERKEWNEGNRRKIAHLSLLAPIKTF